MVLVKNKSNLENLLIHINAYIRANIIYIDESFKKMGLEQIIIINSNIFDILHCIYSYKG